MKRILFVSGILFSLNLYGLTLDEAIQKAYDLNPELKKREYTTEINSWKRLESLSPYLPQLSLSGSQAFSLKYPEITVSFGGHNIGFPSGAPQTSFGVDLSLMVFDGFSKWKLYEASVLNHEASGLEYNYEKFKLVKKIQLKFFQAIGKESIQNLYDQNIRTLENHLSVAKTNKTVGYGIQVDILKIKAKINEAKVEKILAEDDAQVARNEFFELIGITSDDSIKLEGSLETPKVQDHLLTLTYKDSSRDDIKAQQKREASAREEYTSSLLEWFPKISLFANKTYYKYDNYENVIIGNSTYQNSYILGINFSWNLFDGGALISKNFQKQQQEKISKEDSNALLLKVPNDVETWKRRYYYNSKLYEARLLSIEETEEARRLVALSVREGLKSTYDLMESDLDVAKGRIQLIQSQIDTIEARANLELTLGHDL